MKRYEIWLIAAFAGAVGITLAAPFWGRTIADNVRAGDPRVRQALFDLLQPVAVANCQLARFGEPHDGGYLMCANLLDSVQAAYSYGIAGYDEWGCDASIKLRVRLHQYDCFDTRQPACPGGDTVFHAECVGPATKTEEGRLFETMENQFAKNGDSDKRLVVKMDIEGAEWDSLLHASDGTLNRIDQLAIEFHRVNEEKFVTVVQRLKQFFHVAHLHFNNYSCMEGLEPFPAEAYEVLFVNKRIGVVDLAGRLPRVDAADSVNNPGRPDCQVQ